MKRRGTRANEEFVVTGSEKGVVEGDKGEAVEEREEKGGRRGMTDY